MIPYKCNTCLFVWVNRFSRQIGTLRDGTATDLMVVILHTDILFSYLREKDVTQQGKFPPQVISAYILWQHRRRMTAQNVSNDFNPCITFQ